LHSIDLGV